MTTNEIPLGSFVWIKLGLIYHYGRYLGDGLVIHNSKNNMKVSVESLDKFSGGRPIKFTPPGQKITREQLINLVDRLTGSPYSLFSYNCEHFANEFDGGEPRSEQIRAVGIGATIGTLVGTTQNLGGAKTLGLMIAGGLIGLLSVNTASD